MRAVSVCPGAEDPDADPPGGRLRSIRVQRLRVPSPVRARSFVRTGGESQRWIFWNFVGSASVANRQGRRGIVRNPSRQELQAFVDARSGARRRSHSRIRDFFLRRRSGQSRSGAPGTFPSVRPLAQSRGCCGSVVAPASFRRRVRFRRVAGRIGQPQRPRRRRATPGPLRDLRVPLRDRRTGSGFPGTGGCRRSRLV